MAPENDPSPKPDPERKAESPVAPHGDGAPRRETLPLEEGGETIVAAPVLAPSRPAEPANSYDMPTIVGAADDVATARLGADADAPGPEPSRPAAEPEAPPAPPPSPLKPGDVFLGKYKIESLIGAGGMGSVVLARHQDLGTHYAIKVMHTSVPDRSAVDRFKREAKTSAMVDHPNIVRVFDCGEHDGHCYIVMEYLPGENLRQRLGRVGRFSVEEAVRFAGVVCDVLEVMHEMGIVHRDLKPDNIVFAKRGNAERVKILDFGIAKLATASVSGHLTQTGTVVGTPAYMSPEQCMAGQIDGRSDIYALGVILFQLLTGRLPFDSDNLLTMMYLHVNKEPPSAHEIDPAVPEAVSAVVKRMMDKAPENRYQSATACAAALSEAAGVEIPIREGSKTSAARAVSGEHAATPSGPHGTVARGVAGSGAGGAARRRTLGYVGVGALALASVAAGVYYVPGLLDSTQPGTIPSTNNANVVPDGVDPALAARFVAIPGGAATVGARTDDCADMDCEVVPAETPPHPVTLAPYWIARGEVTNQEYAEFVRATGHKAPSHWRESYPRGTDTHPVTNVSWRDAVAYAEWRSKRDGVAYRLPTEAEWEHAARGDDERLFPWGDFWNATWVNADQRSDKGSPLPVDQAPNSTTDVTPQGVTALAGNVCEWTGSAFEAYPGSPYKPTSGDLACKVIRGGSFNTKPNGSRVSYRSWQPPEYTARDVGFRLAAAPPGGAASSR